MSLSWETPKDRRKKKKKKHVLQRISLWEKMYLFCSVCEHGEIFVLNSNNHCYNALCTEEMLSAVRNEHYSKVGC